MGYSGERTNIYQKRINLKNSRARLEALLAANFRDGAQLVTLTYGEGTHIPSRDLAELQLTEWLRAVRCRTGQKLRYIRATERETADSYTVHRVVLAHSAPSAAVLAALWECGPVTVKPMSEDGQEALAALLMAPALHAGRVPVPCCRTWSPSKGLIRPEKENTKDALPEPHGR